MLPVYEQRKMSVLQQGLEAKAGPCRKPGQGLLSAKNGFTTWLGGALVVSSSVLILSVCFATRRGEASQLLTAAPQRRIILVDDVEHLPPLAWKAIPMTLPNSGIVNIDVRVVRGNPIDTFLQTSDQVDILKKVEWNMV